MKINDIIIEASEPLYHATYRPFLDSIMKNGLGGSGAQTQWEDSKPGYVYLAKDPEVAMSHAEANEEVPDEYIDNIVVLKIDTNKLDPNNLEDDPNVIEDDSTLAYKGVIPISAIIINEDQNINEGWKQTLNSLAIAASLTIGSLGALTVKQAMDSHDFTTGQKQEIFRAADLPQSELPPELSPVPKPRPERLLVYKPLTNNAAEQTLLKVAESSGLKGLELAAFMAQMAHESENFSDMVEDHPNIKKYAGKLAKALGNKSVNDAKRFIGRGYIQLTGRWNYEWMQKSLGIDLTSSWSDAHKASNPDIAAKIAVEFWKQRVRPNVTDFSNTAEVTKPINSRLHGLKHRETRFATLAKGLVVRR